MLRVAVIGAGSWGTTVASLLAGSAPTTLWARRDELAEEIRARHTNPTYLPGFELSPRLTATSSLEEAVGDVDLVVMGVPSHTMRATVRSLAPYVRPWIPIVNLAKGLEQGSDKRMTEVISEELPGHPVGMLTGPNIAKEILSEQAAAAVIAFTDDHIAGELRGLFHTRWFRVYVNHDVVGCEVGGALKNVIAIASGMADGLGVGDNTRAAVITRGLAELSQLGEAMGGDPRTFAGLAGMGDLIATCVSPQSRNRHVGEQLGRGRTIAEITGEMAMVAEGVKTSKVVLDLAARYGCQLPIAREVYAVVHEGRTAQEAYRGLTVRRDHPREFR